MITFLPGHFQSEQFLVRDPFPKQKAWSFISPWLLHILVLVCTPPPQEVEQLDHPSHLDHDAGFPVGEQL